MEDNERTYLVIWEIDIEATSPEAAAERAREIQLDPTNIATFFQVLDEEKEEDFGTIDVSDKKTSWERNDLQFPRLLAEIRAAGLTNEQYRQLAESMDLEEGAIDLLLERAETEWERIKKEK